MGKSLALTTTLQRIQGTEEHVKGCHWDATGKDQNKGNSVRQKQNKT